VPLSETRQSRQTILADEAMTDEDWELIGNIVETLRTRYPGPHIEYGPW
jgi:hypothetical protein